MHATFEELCNQHTAAEPSSTHRLAENTGKAAPIGRGVDLQLPLRFHQMQGWTDRHQRTKTSPFESPVVLIQGIRGAMACREAGGHLGCSHPGDPADLECSGAKPLHKGSDTIHGVTFHQATTSPVRLGIS